MSSVSGAHFDEAGLPSHAGAPAQAAPDPVEIDLLRKAKDGDRGAYGKLVAIYQDRLYNAILRIVGDHDDARELAQETFTRGLDKLDGFRRLERFVRTVETRLKPRADFDKLIQHEHAISPSLDGRTVFDDKQRSLF